jgi:myo-inositol catabolism protein IolC
VEEFQPVAGPTPGGRSLNGPDGAPAGRGALLLCAFDHRDYFEQMIDGRGGGDLSRFATIATAKELVLEACLLVRKRTAPAARDGLGIFVDEQYGAHVALRARAERLVLAMPAERSRAGEFLCEFGERFAGHLDTFDPQLVKVLVRHNPEDDAALLNRQTARLRALSDWCRTAGRQLLFELLVPALPEQQAPDYVDRQRLPLTLRALDQLIAGGIRPAVWKLEAPSRSGDFARLLSACRAADPDVRVVVLGGGADVDATVTGIDHSAAAGYDGFAVGRTIWAGPLDAWLSGGMSRDHAIAEMASTYEACIAAYLGGVARRPAEVPA